MPADRRGEDARRAFEQSAVPMAFADSDGRFTFANRALARILGRSEDWLVGQLLTSVLHPLDDHDFGGRLSRLARGLTDALSDEVMAPHADGRTLQLKVDVSLIRQSDGSPRGVLLMAQDLTTVRSAEERLAGQERLYRALSHRTADAAMVTDADMVVTFASPALLDMLGLDAVDVFSAKAIEVVHPEDQPQVRAAVAGVRAEARSAERTQVRIRAKGGWRWAEVTVINSLADPDVGGLIVNVRDVTAELEAQRAVRESEARYRAVVETAQEGIFVMDAAGHIDLVNDRMAAILGVSADEIRTSTLVQALLGDASGVTDTARSMVRQEVRYAHPDGAARVLSVSSTPLPEGDDRAGTLVMVSDVTEAHELQERLRHQAMHDQLTGLPNRYLFADRLEMAAARRERDPTDSTAVMYLDLDHFKAVNDRFGHAVGDDVLRTVGSRLVEAVRVADTVARLGGDEFAIICEGLDEDAARIVASRIQNAVFRELEHQGQSFSIGASIGIAMFPPHSPRRALALADKAMYRAKHLKDTAVIVFGVDEDSDDIP